MGFNRKEATCLLKVLTSLLSLVRRSLLSWRCLLQTRSSTTRCLPRTRRGTADESPTSSPCSYTRTPRRNLRCHLSKRLLLHFPCHPSLPTSGSSSSPAASVA